MADGTITREELAELIAAYDMPQALRDHFTGKSQADGLVHWHCLPEQEVLTPFGIGRPSRCGRFAYDTWGFPLEYVTCPQCLKLAAADDA